MGCTTRTEPLTREQMEARRLAGGHDLLNGESQANVARKYGVDPSVTNRWDKIVKEKGIGGLRAKKAKGYPRRLSPEQIDKLKIILSNGPRTTGFDGNKWSLKWMAEVIRKEFDIDYHNRYLSQMMKKLDFDWRSIRSEQTKEIPEPYRPKLSREEMERRRLSAVEDIRNNMPSDELAYKYGVDVSSANRWKRILKEEGEDGLMATKAEGAPSKLTSEQCTKLKEIIDEKSAEDYGFEYDFWTLLRIAHVVKVEFGVEYHSNSLSRLLKRIEVSCQKPQKKAVERDEKKRQEWLDTTWKQALKN